MSALSQLDDRTTIEELTRELEKPVESAGRRIRGLRVLDPTDRQLFETVI
jgi:hypothetical protein